MYLEEELFEGDVLRRHDVTELTGELNENEDPRPILQSCAIPTAFHFHNHTILPSSQFLQSCHPPTPFHICNHIIPHNLITAVMLSSLNLISTATSSYPTCFLHRVFPSHSDYNCGHGLGGPCKYVVDFSPVPQNIKTELFLELSEEHSQQHPGHHWEWERCWYEKIQ